MRPWSTWHRNCGCQSSVCEGAFARKDPAESDHDRDCLERSAPMTTSFASYRTTDRQIERVGGPCKKKVSKRRTQACATVLLALAASLPAHAENGRYRSIDPAGVVHMTDAPGDRKITSLTSRHRYHAAVSDRELEEAVAHYARENRLSPALLMAIMKAESGFNPLAISKAG